MASKKKVSSKKGIAKRPSTGMSIAAIKEQLQEEASNIQNQIGAPATQAIKIRDKVFTMPDGTVVQDSLDIVIIDFVSRNNFYEGKWDPNNIEAPACFAIDKSANALVPSVNSPDMQVKKGQSCSECAMNQWGSDGEGKACKNTRLLAVVLPDADDVQVYTLSVPPTAIKGFDGYVGSVAKLFNLPPIGVRTTVTFHQEKTYPLPLFSNPEPNEAIEAHFAYRPDALAMLMVEPEVTTAAAPTKKKGRR